MWNVFSKKENQKEQEEDESNDLLFNLAQEFNVSMKKLTDVNVARLKRLFKYRNMTNYTFDDCYEGMIVDLSSIILFCYERIPGFKWNDKDNFVAVRSSLFSLLPKKSQKYQMCLRCCKGHQIKGQILCSATQLRTDMEGNVTFSFVADTIVTILSECIPEFVNDFALDIQYNVSLGTSDGQIDIETEKTLLFCPYKYK